MLEAVFITFLAFSCPETKIINQTDIWTVKDQHSLEVNKNSCQRHFNNLPCMIKFIKVGELHYRATCGKEI